MTTIVSAKYGYIFFHIPKNGGSSLQTALRRCEGNEFRARMTWRILSRLRTGFQTLDYGKYENKHGWARTLLALNGHITATNLRDLMPYGQFRDMYKFAVVRNPWDRCVSRYQYFCETSGRTDMDFPAFLDWDFQPQFDRIADEDGNFLVDKICKLETLEADMADVIERLNLPLRVSDIPFLNRSGRSAYQDYYDDKTHDLVAEKYKRDIETFGYAYQA